MRALLACLCATIFLISTGFGQERVDVIYLKNGDVRKGIIIENVPNNYVRIEMSDGSIFTIKYADIQKMTKEMKTAPAYQQSSGSQVIQKSTPARAGTLGLGIKGALNFATLGSDDDSDFETVTKFGVGGFLTYDVLDQLALQGELLYNQKGCKWEETGAALPSRTITVAYLDIAAQAKYVIPVDGNIKPALFAGPSLGILLSANRHDEGGGQSRDMDLKADAAGSDFGLVFGAGILYKIGDNGLLIDARYYLGLSDIEKESSTKLTNRVFSINVGYAFM